MGIGPIPAVRKLLARVNMSMNDIDHIRIERSFRSAGPRRHSNPRSAGRQRKVNPNGGAIALGHPLGMSGARLVLTASRQLKRTNARYAVAAMCIGVGQGIAVLLERV